MKPVTTSGALNHGIDLWHPTVVNTRIILSIVIISPLLLSLIIGNIVNVPILNKFANVSEIAFD